MGYGAGRLSRLVEGTAKGGGSAWCDGQLREPTRGVGDRSVYYKRISLAVEGEGTKGQHGSRESLEKA